MPTTTDHGFPGIYNSTLNTVPDGKGGALAIDSNQRLILGTGTAVIGSVIAAGDVASDAADSGNPVKVGLKVNVTSPTFTDGDRADMQGDINAFLKNREQYVDQFVDQTNAVAAMVIKPLSVSTYSPTLFTNFGANTTLNIKATPGNVFSFYVTNTNAAVRYFQLHNTATTPAGGAVPLRTYTLPALTGVLIIGTDVLTTAGVNFSTGIAYATSTTAGTYTAATAGDHYVEVNFK
jgi:hypothetical protein